MSWKTSFRPSSRNHLYEFFCTSIRFGISRTSLIFPKFILTFFPHCFGVTFTIGEKPPLLLSELAAFSMQMPGSASLQKMRRSVCQEPFLAVFKKSKKDLTERCIIWYTIVPKNTSLHFDTFYNYIILPNVCQGVFLKIRQIAVKIFSLRRFFV